uniref:Uncharacterized protein n=1 Tax=Rhizophora mucronata TaxID=61149 RepID=A0A2P2QXS9_RHIMU
MVYGFLKPLASIWFSAEMPNLLISQFYLQVSSLEAVEH